MKRIGKKPIQSSARFKSSKENYLNSLSKYMKNFPFFEVISLIILIKKPQVDTRGSFNFNPKIVISPLGCLFYNLKKNNIKSDINRFATAVYNFFLKTKFPFLM